MAEQAINVLFLGGSRRVSVAEEFIKAGAAAGKKIFIFAYELSPFEPIATVGRIVEGLRWTAPDILQGLKQAIVENGIDIVVPFVDIATILCAKLANEFPRVHFCVSEENICEILFDKKKSNEWFAERKFLIPSTEKKPPLVAKPVTGSGGKGIRFLLNEADLENFLTEKTADDYFVQEVINGEEFSVDCYVGPAREIISVVPRKRLEVVNGEAVRSITVKDESIVRTSAKILAAGEFKGPVTIQYIRETHTHKTYLIEINPRLGSGVLTSIRAGANVCTFILNDYLNIANNPYNGWDENLMMVRAFQEFYFHATNH